ncbi:tyrosine-type recombinase/integrase [Streptomyces sp. NEAU-W12]|uniref:tyrosine-type recombinase/integrase n=1 Tax=Streptomyces sp. NEAU-W12 TaxID=2994668 RepID=UPI00224B27FC|nr:site-specific integrase [Streptomyces sp. NEAU-W12]MCX2927947.1 site-specific integrase [Streptomyces sp. NEAU-W12]
MTAMQLESLSGPEEVADEATTALLAAITPEFAAAVQWDPTDLVVVFPQQHLTLGWKKCVVPGCVKARSLASGVCASCHGRWRRLGNPPMEEYIKAPKVFVRMVGVRLCTVTGCERPWKSERTELCLAHEVQKRKLRVSLEEFLAMPEATGHASLGPCRAASCLRERAGRGAYCLGHYNRWRKAVGAQPDLDEEQWRRTVPAIAEDNKISLRGLPLRVAAEFVYGLQQRSQHGVKTRFNMVRPLIDQIRLQQPRTLSEVPPESLKSSMRHLRNEFVRHCELLQSTPETERHKDLWTLAVFGYAGNLHFTDIRQPWLREATKAWAFDALPQRRGRGVAGSMQASIEGIVQLSESLHLQCDDHGENLRSLTRTDITAFCNRLAYLQDQGELSSGLRSRHCHSVLRLLARMRTMGLTRPGRPLHGLPEDFALGREDLPDEPEDQEAGRDLPIEAIRHLCSHLGKIDGGSGVEVRAAIELLIDTGRRPDEICQLPWDCLMRDQDGKPVLIYDNRKAHRLGRRLPISEAMASVIVRQQEAARGRFPDTPVADLALLPSTVANPDGRKSISADWVSGRHRTWVDSLPEILVPTAVETDGRTETRMLPFDKRRIYLYAYRHTFAQRYADAGVRVEVLKELMDHKQLSTTQCYYRVGEKRRREAVDRVTTMQFDRHGSRIWRQATALLDSEHARRAVGEVAVPYGICTEPTNVAAGGGDCPVRFRCVGCAHFRTDVSFLPDLEAYLSDLLRNRERLLATVDADQWAKDEAMPSDEEIRRVRRLINRIKADVDELDDDERARIEQAVTTIRRARNSVVNLGIPRLRQPLPDIRPDRSA